MKLNRNKTDQNVEITNRLRQIELLEMPRLASPRRPVDGVFPPLLEVERHVGQMYVAGHEPHLRPVTLLQQARPPRHAGSEPT
jgi:hypothetical protein